MAPRPYLIKFLVRLLSLILDVDIHRNTSLNIFLDLRDHSIWNLAETRRHRSMFRFERFAEIGFVGFNRVELNRRAYAKGRC